MGNVNVSGERYTVESLYQWDLNQVLTIYGLSMPTIPEIHFTNEAMSRAIVRQATMDDAGVIRVDIPNSLLQKPYALNVYVCMYTGETFESVYKLVVPVKARKRPADYVIVEDEEIYSFNALENKLDNTIALSLERYADLNAKHAALNAQYAEVNAKYDDTVELFEEAIDQYDRDMEYIAEVEKRVAANETNIANNKTAADNALALKEDKANKVTSISASSTDTQYPSAKAVYDMIGDVESAIASINGIIGA